MCLGVPGQIKDIYERDGARMGKVDFGGIIKQINLSYVPEAKTGDFVLVHVGFALTVIDVDEAERVLEYLRGMGELDELREAVM